MRMKEKPIGSSRRISGGFVNTMKTLTYQEEKENNERIFSEMIQKIRPEIYVLMSLIDSTGINPFILYKVI